MIRAGAVEVRMVGGCEKASRSAENVRWAIVNDLRLDGALDTEGGQCQGASMGDGSVKVLY